MAWIGTGGAGVTVVAATESLWQRAPLRIGAGGGGVIVADTSDVRARRQTLNGKKKACVRDGSDVRRCFI
jgi:hypothetical protein